MFQQYYRPNVGPKCPINNSKSPAFRADDSRNLLPFLVGAAVAFPIGYIASNTNKFNYQQMPYPYPMYPQYPAYPQYPSYQMPIAAQPPMYY